MVVRIGVSAVRIKQERSGARMVARLARVMAARADGRPFRVSAVVIENVFEAGVMGRMVARLAGGNGIG